MLWYNTSSMLKRLQLIIIQEMAQPTLARSFPCGEYRTNYSPNTATHDIIILISMYKYEFKTDNSFGVHVYDHVSNN